VIRHTRLSHRLPKGAMLGRALTVEQYASHAASHRRLLSSLVVAIVYCAGIVAADSFVTLEPYGMYLAIAGFPVVGLVIWGMARFRCPVCRSTPQARSLSLASGEITYSSMVALFPKECSHCGVRFAGERPQGEA
jgi:hypothetical protein